MLVELKCWTYMTIQLCTSVDIFNPVYQRYHAQASWLQPLPILRTATECHLTYDNMSRRMSQRLSALSDGTALGTAASSLSWPGPGFGCALPGVSAEP